VVLAVWVPKTFFFPRLPNEEKNPGFFPRQTRPSGHRSPLGSRYFVYAKNGSDSFEKNDTYPTLAQIGFAYSPWRKPCPRSFGIILQSAGRRYFDGVPNASRPAQRLESGQHPLTGTVAIPASFQPGTRTLVRRPPPPVRKLYFPVVNVVPGLARGYSDAIMWASVELTPKCAWKSYVRTAATFDGYLVGWNQGPTSTFLRLAHRSGPHCLQ